MSVDITKYELPEHAYFLTFSCYKKRRLLDEDRCKRVVIQSTLEQLQKRNGQCLGFVIMPDHIHAIIRFTEDGQLVPFIQYWKKTSSYRLKSVFREYYQQYLSLPNLNDPIWQRHYYSFNIQTEEKLLEKLGYIHSNPVKAGLAETPEAWLYSSARFYENGRSGAIAIEWMF
jgi:putative transposase